MIKKLLLGLIICLSVLFSASAQTRFKFANWNATQLSGGLSYYAFGGVVDKRFRINQEIRTGLFYKSMEFSFTKDKYNFEDFLLQQHPDLTPAEYDSIAECHVAFGYLSIPLGYSVYLGPRFYVGYNLNLNFSLGNSKYVANDSDLNEIRSGKLDKGMVQSVFIDHEVSLNFIILRRIEFFTGISWNINSSLLKKDSSYKFVQQFGNASARYSMMRIGFNIYLFQLKRQKL